MSMFPLARTPLDKDSAHAMQNYSQSIRRQIDGLTPWQENDLRSRLRGKVKPGTIVVIPDETDAPNDPLYAEADVLKG